MTAPAQVMDDADKARTQHQADAILNRLRAGPATNAELAQLSLKYTSRISDLRQRGHSVICTRGKDGLMVYRLGVPRPEGVADTFRVAFTTSRQSDEVKPPPRLHLCPKCGVLRNGDGPHAPHYRRPGELVDCAGAVLSPVGPRSDPDRGTGVQP